MDETPFQQIQHRLSKVLSAGNMAVLPSRWEKQGDVVVVKLPEKLQRYSQEIGNVYADVLGCKSVLNDVGGISGVYRKPQVTLIFGSDDTKTVHVENGVHFQLDPQEVMFSSGNMDERIRMATIARDGEVVVDLFAGIGYFSLPIAVHSRPKKVYACEMNPVAYDFLRENIVLNDVTHLVKPLLGDNQQIAPRGIADRVIMGYLQETWRFLPTGFECLRDTGGVLHYHEVGSDKNIVSNACNRIQQCAYQMGREVAQVKSRIIKSYAPGVAHVVIDALVKKR